MTKEQKKVLLTDLSSRLSYGVEIWHEHFPSPLTLTPHILSRIWVEDDEFKPYLRPMSSMTNGEYEEYCYLNECTHLDDGTEVPCVAHINYLLKHHFDYRGLIPMGLALEAPNGMY